MTDSLAEGPLPADGTGTATAPAPFVSIVIPTLDEARYLDRCVRSLLDDPYPRDRLEILVVDGGSRDGTVAIAERLMVEVPFLRLLRNPRRLQAAAFNLALQGCDRRCDYLLRCDAHAAYPPGFVSRAAAAMARTGAALVAFADAPEATGCFQRAVAFAQTTLLGVGNSWYRRGGVSRYVDHGKHGCFRRDPVERLGGYDEAFSHNEDSELSLRLHQAGERVWLDAGLAVGYAPRASAAALARQYFLYGRGRAQTVLKHRLRPRPRQVAPAALVVLELLALAAAPVWPAALWLFPAYAVAVAAAGAHGALRRRSPCVLLASVALAIMHHAWGTGFLWRFLAGRRATGAAGRGAEAA